MNFRKMLNMMVGFLIVLFVIFSLSAAFDVVFGKGINPSDFPVRQDYYERHDVLKVISSYHKSPIKLDKKRPDNQNEYPFLMNIPSETVRDGVIVKDRPSPRK